MVRSVVKWFCRVRRIRAFQAQLLIAYGKSSQDWHNQLIEIKLLNCCHVKVLESKLPKKNKICWIANPTAVEGLIKTCIIEKTGFLNSCTYRMPTVSCTAHVARQANLSHNIAFLFKLPLVSRFCLLDLLKKGSSKLQCCL